MKVIGIQYQSISPEAAVFSTLLSAMQQGGEGQEKNVFKVIQFNDEKLLAFGEHLRLIPGVQVLSVHTGGSLGAYEARRKKIPVLGRFLLSLPKIVIASFSFRPDVIYTSQQRWDARLGMVLSLLLRKPHVIHLHCIPGPWLGKEVTWQLGHCRRVICVSDFVQQRSIKAGVPPDRLVAIRNVLSARSMAVDISAAQARQVLCNELNIPASDVLVGMVARFSPYKGQYELVQAMVPLLAEEGSTCRLILAGGSDPSGAYLEKILQFAREKGIISRVHWLGWRSDVPVLLRTFDVFAHPSYDEGCGMAVLEALLAGLPTIVWKEGGSAELVLDGQTGFTAETGNIEALTLALRRLCADATLRATMRHNALADAVRLTDTHSAAQQFHAVLVEAARSQAKPRWVPKKREARQ